jgi:hypothetical protein
MSKGNQQLQGEYSSHRTRALESTVHVYFFFNKGIAFDSPDTRTFEPSCMERETGL